MSDFGNKTQKKDEVALNPFKEMKFPRRMNIQEGNKENRGMKGPKQMNTQEGNKENRGMKSPKQMNTHEGNKDSRRMNDKRQMNNKGEWKKNGPQSEKMIKQCRDEKREKKTAINQNCYGFPYPSPNYFGMATIPPQAMYPGMQVPQGMHYGMQIPLEMYYGVQLPQGMAYGMQIMQGMFYGNQIPQGIYYGMDPSKKQEIPSHEMKVSKHHHKFQMPCSKRM